MKPVLLVLALALAGCTEMPGDVTLPVWEDNAIDVSEAPAWLADDFDKAAALWAEHGVVFHRGAGAVRLIAGDPGEWEWGKYRVRGVGAGEIVMTPELETSLNPTCPLAHELGHVVGLLHVSEVGDLMSEISSLTDDRSCPWTESDEIELRRVGGRL